jgi:hypothetical protein
MACRSGFFSAISARFFRQIPDAKMSARQGPSRAAEADDMAHVPLKIALPICRSGLERNAGFVPFAHYLRKTLRTAALTLNISIDK